MENRRDTLDALRKRFEELSAALARLQQEWSDATAEGDRSREIRIIAQESAIFKEATEVIRDFADIVARERSPR